jgi:hypothetical protein
MRIKSGTTPSQLPLLPQLGQADWPTYSTSCTLPRAYMLLKLAALTQLDDGLPASALPPPGGYSSFVVGEDKHGPANTKAASAPNNLSSAHLPSADHFIGNLT